MSCGGGGQSGWLLEYGLVEEEIQGSDFIYMVDDPAAVSSVILGFDVPRKEDGGGSSSGGQDNSASKKRSRPESSAPPGTKACREKLRRDRLNERHVSHFQFSELSAILEPGKPPRADKVSILSDAARLLSQLRAEAQKLKSSNESLQDSIKSLKAEKSELRDEKTRLKAERERLEQMLKGVGAAAAAAPAPFVPRHAAAVAAAPAYHPAAAAAFAQAGGKYVPYATSYAPPAAFWQWIPPTSLDTSKDPVMWPPVA
uniref:BHLH domain-containing protein n=1 Tax=Oryza punctata TaxID=4537 RepID=A0A0E0L3A6_ORYPU